MNLYIQQKVFSFGDRFAVWDAGQNPVYYVEGEVFTFGKKLHIYDTQNREVCFISQELFRFTPTYQIQIPGRGTVSITKRMTFFVPHYSIDGVNWEVEGDFFDHDYRITAPQGEVAALSKEWFTWGDAYQLNVYRPEDALLSLAVVLAIDAANDRD